MVDKREPGTRGPSPKILGTPLAVAAAAAC